MDGAVIEERCVLSECVVGKRCKIGKASVLKGCEVQDGMTLAEGTEGVSGSVFAGWRRREEEDEDGNENGE
ncbi:hypothetical protein GJ744_006504 [Endocarpon pusillum]|uniref:Mannose-1-phosphate guanylyltransferase n=1 Tax=Endocarpon pusillum TaxID=364733 RepID=A0A8H7AZA5_9EURO|nr:hypothetical protein GJ744_006504 [Endocarpon pusillum]